MSSIPLSPLPSLLAPVSVPANSSDGLDGYYSLASGVVNALTPGKLPHSNYVKAKRATSRTAIIESVLFCCFFMAGTIVSIVSEQLDLEDILSPQNSTQIITNEVRRLCS